MARNFAILGFETVKQMFPILKIPNSLKKFPIQQRRIILIIAGALHYSIYRRLVFFQRARTKTNRPAKFGVG